MSTKRPTGYEPDIIEAAEKELAKRLAEWSKGVDDSTDEEGWADVAHYVAGECQVEPDGYKLARDIEDRFHVDPDFELVELLDNANFVVKQEMETAINRWVAETKPACPFAIGDHVLCKPLRSCASRQEFRGTVVDIWYRTAQVVVSSAPAAELVLEGPKRTRRGHLHDWEDCTKITETSKETQP